MKKTVIRSARIGGLLALPLFLVTNSPALPTAAPAAPTQKLTDSGAFGAAKAEFAAFASWADQYANSTDLTSRAERIAEGVSLAKSRRSAFTQLIKTDPAKALASTVPTTLRQQLPAEVVAELETTISGVGDLTVNGILRAKGGPEVEPLQRFVEIDGVKYRAYVYGRRAFEGSKKGISLSGVALDGVLAVRESGVRELGPEESVDASRNVTISSLARRASDSGGDRKSVV